MPRTMPARIQTLWAKWDADDQKWLADFLKAVEEKYQDTTTRMVLFGSRARGDWNEDSDIDVLVIVRNEASGAKNGIQELGASLSVGGTAMPMVIAQTEAEWKTIGESGLPLHGEVEAEGVRIL